MPARASNGSLFGRQPQSGGAAALTKVHDPAMLSNLLYPTQRGSVATVYADFIDNSDITRFFTLNKDAGATSYVTTAGLASGVARATSGTTDNDVASAFGLTSWAGVKNCGMELRSKVSAITGIALEIGFIDALTTKTDMAVSDVDTPAFAAGVTEAALFAWDTDQTIATPRWVSDSATFTTAKGTNVLDAAGAAWTPTADTYFTVRVQLTAASSTGSTIDFTLLDANHNLISKACFDVIDGGGTGGLTSATLLAPWFAMKTNNITSKTHDVDYFYAWQDR